MTPLKKIFFTVLRIEFFFHKVGALKPKGFFICLFLKILDLTEHLSITVSVCI